MDEGEPLLICKSGRWEATQVNRRRVLIGVLGLAFLPATRVAASPEIPVTPEAILTAGATPSADLAAYNGPLEDIWQQPWLLEKKLVSFDGVIIRIPDRASRSRVATRFGPVALPFASDYGDSGRWRSPTDRGHE